MPFALPLRLGLRAYVLALAVLVLATGLWLHAALLHPGTRVPGGFSDETAALRQAWAAQAQHRSPFSISHDALTGAPEGESLSTALELSNGAVQTAFVWKVSGLLGLVGAWNAFIALGFIGTGLAMFALLDGLGCTFGPALFGAYLFAFNPYTLERTVAGHSGFLQNWVFVALVGLLIRMRSKRSVGAAAAAGLWLGFAFYIGAYDYLFAAFIAGVFVVVELARLPERRERVRSVALAGVGLAVSLALVSPVIVLYARQQKVAQTEVAHASSDFYEFSAKLQSYLIPSPRNPFFHWLRNVHPRDLTEQTLFFGYLSLALAVAAVVMLYRRRPWYRATASRWWTCVFFAVLAPAAFVLSLPPTYTIGTVTIPMPSLTMAVLTSFWRVYSRFGLIFGFGVAVLAASALSAFTASRAGRWRLLAPAALAFVALFELLPGNVAAFNTTSRPGWVVWLADHPHGIVATYPPAFGKEPAFALSQEDFWYTKLDGHPRFFFFGLGAVGTRARPNLIRVLSRNLTDPLTPRILATEGVRYVVVHDDVYRAEGHAPPRLDPAVFSLVGRVPRVRIYTVSAPHVDLDAELKAHRGEIARLEGKKAPARAPTKP